ncbi:MAG: c-type cytochrome [Planctomycetes bacterium]|nr:c-type cytochrome [Planctomycetota bacterium]
MTLSDWNCWRPVRWLVTVLVIGAGFAGCPGTRDGPAGTARDPTDQAQPRIETVAANSGPSSASVKRGKQLFDTLGCTACHMVNGQGGRVGPDLSDEAAKGHSRSWLTTQIRTPKANDPQTIMSAYGSLSDEQVNDLVDYLLTLSTAPGSPTGKGHVARPPEAGGQAVPAVAASVVAAGGEMWARRCGQCHNLRPPSEYSDAQWTVAVHHMRVRVPLTGEEQQKILTFLQASN